MRTLIKTTTLAVLAVCLCSDAFGQFSSGMLIRSSNNTVTSQLVVGQFSRHRHRTHQGATPFAADVTTTSTIAASAFTLDQNYPNPFVSSTTVRFGVPSDVSVPVKVSVYNGLGSLVETLVNDRLQAGTHEVSFTGTDLPSGIYTLELRAGSVVQLRQMLLQK